MHRFGCFTYSTEHASENKFMKGDDRIPVEEPSKSTWTKASGHNKSRDRWFPFRFNWFNFKIKLRFARQFHFSSEGEGAISVDTNNSPEIECLTELDCFWKSSSSAKTWASNKRVHPPSDAPEDVSCIPSVPSANTANCCIEACWICFNIDDTFVGKNCAASPRWITRNRASNTPPSLYSLLFDFFKSPSYRFTSTKCLVWHESLGCVVSHNNTIFESFGKWASDSV